MEDAWPPIVEHGTFERVQAILKKRTFITLHPKRVASHYLLSGIAKRGHCGKALVGQEAKGGKFNYYTCGTLLKKGSGSCPAKYINRAKLERMVIDNIRKQILSDRKVGLADMHTVTHCVEDLRNMLCHSSVTENKSFIQSFIREVKVTGKEVTIRYSMQVPCGLVTERATMVPPIVHCGGQ